MSSIDNVMLEFFKGKLAIKADCDKYVYDNFGPFELAKIQGSQSYTVITSSNNVVQFRADVLDLAIWAQAQNIYGELVPHCQGAGKIEELSIFIADRIRGICYMQWVLGSNDRRGNMNVVVDLANFFALSWKNRIRSSTDSASIQKEFRDKLTTLSTVLPKCFKKNLQLVLGQLESLFTTTYPQVLSHDDLNEMNIMVDADGNIVGIIDWADARVLPFGVSLYGLENILGHMDGEGWHYCHNHLELRALFWSIFKEQAGGISDADMHSIMVARRAGLFMRYGFTWDGNKHTPNKDDPYLDAFCITKEAQ